MWNEPTSNQLEKLPKLYETEGVSLEDKMIHMHFFIGGSDWYIAEYDPVDRLMFGYAILNNDLLNSEWGIIPYDELKELSIGPGFEIDRDLHWKPARAIDVDRIKEAYEYKGWL